MCVCLDAGDTKKKLKTGRSKEEGDGTTMKIVRKKKKRRKEIYILSGLLRRAAIQINKTDTRFFFFLSFSPLSIGDEYVYMVEVAFFFFTVCVCVFYYVTCS